MGAFLETVAAEYNRMRARAFSDGYEGVTHAGIALVARDTGRVLLAQRAFDDSDDEDVRETWEFPGGGLDEGEEPYAGALREFSEEVVLPIPDDAMVVGGWRSSDGVYQGFVLAITAGIDVEAFTPNEEVQALSWWTRAQCESATGGHLLRPEVRDETDWDMIFNAVSGNEDTMTASAGETTEIEEPTLSLSDAVVHSIPVHGVLAPEDTESGDGRGFTAGAMTSRPGRLPFMWQEKQTAGHDNSGVVGSVDRLMRKDGLIHWEGAVMGGGRDAGDFVDLLAFMGRFGVSVDGDRGSFDAEKSKAEGMTWFNAVRASGLTAVAIPAFHEAYVAFGPHPDMPARDDDTLTASMAASGDLVTFDRGPGWVTHPVETNRIHDYWTKPGQPGYAKINWGTSGDFTRAKKLIGAKIAANSPEDMRYLNQIIAQWHFDALGYWPGELGKPGNAPATLENRRRAARHAAAAKGIEMAEDGESWEVVMTSSAGTKVRPPMHYFERQEGSGSLYIAETPDANGFRQTWGYAGEYGVCHIGYDGRCVEIPEDDDFSDFHLGYTRTDAGMLRTGVIAYKVDHRDASQILTETPEQSHFDNVATAWAQVRLGYDDRGIWFAGVVLPNIDEDDIRLIEATGQVSGEWKYGALRALQSVNTPGFGVKSSAEYDENGEVIAMVASAHNLKGCEPSPAERMAALKAAHEEAEAETKFSSLRAQWASREGN